MAVLSPLDSPFIQQISDKRSQTVSLRDSSEFKLDSFLTVRLNPSGVEYSKWLHILSITKIGIDLALWMKNTRRRSLISIDGFTCCPYCLTSEYIRSDKKLNIGIPTCRRCYASLLNNSLEISE